MLTLVLIPFFLAALAPGLYRLVRAPTGTVLAVVPAALFAWFVTASGDVTRGEAWVQSWTWVEELRILFAFRLDGLSPLFPF